MVSPEGDNVTAYSAPSCPSPIGGRAVATSCPSAIDQMRTVLSSLSALRFSWLVAVSWATPPELTGAEPPLAVAVDGGFAAGAALAAGFAGAGAGGGGAGGGCSFVSSVDAYWYSPPRSLIFAS